MQGLEHSVVKVVFSLLQQHKQATQVTEPRRAVSHRLLNNRVFFRTKKLRPSVGLWTFTIEKPILSFKFNKTYFRLLHIN